MMQHLNEETCQFYVKVREEIRVSDALGKQAQEHDIKIREMEEQIAQMDVGRDKRVQLFRKRIVEEILTLKCPRCKRAFIDFDGCFALTCGACRCGFCAYCLQDCGNDAHRHVANCQHNIAPGRDVFAGRHIFDRAQKERRTRLIKSFIAREVEADLRNNVVQSLHRELQDLGIDI